MKKLEYAMRDKYETLTEFVKRTRIPVSLETCRKLLYARQPVSTESLILILKYLDFAPAEIKRYLREGSKSKLLLQKPDNLQMAKDFADLIGDNNVILTSEEKAMIKICVALKNHKDAFDTCIGLIATLNGSLGLGLDKEIEMLDKRGRK